ncbi:MAG: Ig-like domain-containing protein [bacterium]|nr:Ig-like domain-containing protein [bacterium]
MRRFWISLLVALASLHLLNIEQPSAQDAAQTHLEGRISEVRPFGDTQGLTLQSPPPVPLADNASLQDETGAPVALTDLADRVFENRDQLRVTVDLNANGAVERLIVVGLEAPAPESLGENQKSFTLFFVDTSQRTLTPSPLPFIEVTPTTVETRGTRILGQDGARITLSDLQPGTLVDIVGAQGASNFIAAEIHVLQIVETRYFGGIIVRIERESNTRGTLYFKRDNAQWVDRRANIYLNGENLGSGLQFVADILNGTSEPVTVALSEQNAFEPNGKWGRVDVEVGKTFLGTQWNNDRVTFQLPGNSDEAVQIPSEGDDGSQLYPAQASFPVDEHTSLMDWSVEGGAPLSFGDLTEFMNVSINFEVAGDQILSANLGLNERPRDVTLTLNIAWSDHANNNIGFETSPSIRMVRSARFLDLSGNPVDIREFENIQHQGSNALVAVVTLNADGTGAEARLAQPGVTAGPNEVVVGQVGNLRLGFWVSPENNEIGSHGFSGVFTSETVLRGPNGETLPPGLLDSGIQVEISGAYSSGQLYMRNVVVLSEIQPFDVTARIRFIDRSSQRIEFDELPPIFIADDAQVFDYFGDPASLSFLAELLQQAELQLRLTMDSQTQDGAPAASRVEAFRVSENVPVSDNQRLILGGRIDAFNHPKQVIPQGLTQVQYNNNTSVLDVLGNPIHPSELQERVQVRVIGQSISREKQNQWDDARTYFVERIEVLGGIVTEYRGVLSQIDGNTLIFRAPQPLLITSQTDLREETNFNIDLFTLADRIRNEGGLRLWLGADFFSPGTPQVWWARVMRSDEPAPSHLSNNDLIAFFVEVNEENRTIVPAPIPPITLGDNTAITDRSGQELARSVLVPGAQISVLAEERSGTLLASEVQVENVPEFFEFVAPVDYIDELSRSIHFQVPPFITVAQDAHITDLEGNAVTLSELRQLLFNIDFDDRILGIVQSPDSPSDAPIANAVRILNPNALLDLVDDEFIIFIDNPSFRIGVQNRRLEPSPLPPISLAVDADIRGLDGQPIEISAISPGSRIHVLGQDSQGRTLITELRVVGGRSFTAEATLGEIDVANRLISAAPDPSLRVNPRAYIEDADGRVITLSILNDFLRREPNLLLAIQINPYEQSVSALRLIDPKFGFGPRYDQTIVEGDQIEIDVENRQIVFRPEPPAKVAETARITGPEGETFTLADLEPGMRVFARGEEFGDDTIVTALTVIPRVDNIQVFVEAGDFDEEGVANDVVVDVHDQNGNPLSLPVRFFVDFSPPVEGRSGYVFNNLPPGPHVVEAKVPSIPELFARARIFISATGSSFNVAETRPAANATGVPTLTDLSIIFSEPVRQFGDFISISGALNPPPASGDLGESLEVENDGKTLIFRNVQLAEATDYTLDIFSATSRSGNTLKPFKIQFSTGGQLARLGSMAGSVSLTDNLLFIGTVRLFNSENKPVAEASLGPNGEFSLTGIFADTYRVSAQVSAEDGRSTSGFMDANGDGQPDVLTLSDGETLENLNLSLTLPTRAQPGEAGPNANAEILLDLDTRNGNQELDNLNVLPDSEIRVAVYAKDVQDLLGFNMFISYDTTAVSFKSVSDKTGSEENLLRSNGGTALTLPPTVLAGSVEFAGAIMGPTGDNTASGSGLLAEFRFRAKRNFSSQTEFLVPRVILESRSASDTFDALARATISPSTDRTILRLTADPDTIPADGQSGTTLRAELRNTEGETITDEVTVQFQVVSGEGRLSQSEVTTSSGVAETRLVGTTAGHVTVEASTRGINEQVTIVLEEAESPFGDGSWYLDLNASAGDQEKRELNGVKAGQEFTVELINTQGITNSLGGAVRIQFDPEKLEPLTDSITGITGLLGSPTVEDGLLRFSLASLSGVPVTSGHFAEVKFRALDGFSGDTRITLVSAEIGNAETFEQIASEPNTSIFISSSGGSGPTPDFDGDGEVAFRDFVMFAQKYGSAEGDGRFEPQFDLDSDGEVAFRDFVLFAQNYGKSASEFVPPGSKIALGKTALSSASLHLVPAAGQTSGEVTLLVNLTDAQNISGYDLHVQYDPNTLEWIGAQSLAPSRFSGDPVVHHTAGALTVADMFSSSTTLQGESGLVRLRFRILDETLPGRVEISQALVADGTGLVSTLPGVRASELRALPETFALNQNYPNPFNPETVVPFALPQAGKVRIAVYNILGQEIRTLVQGVKEAGFHRITWDGKDAHGRSISSGLYFVHMATPGFTDVRKMMLLK